MKTWIFLVIASILVLSCAPVSTTNAAISPLFSEPGEMHINVQGGISFPLAGEYIFEHQPFLINMGLSFHFQTFSE